MPPTTQVLHVAHHALQPPPGYGVANAVTVPATVTTRRVYGTAGSWGVLGLPEFQCFVETGVGTGVFHKEVYIAGGINSMHIPFSFCVPGGRRYYFDRQDSSLGLHTYNYEDES